MFVSEARQFLGLPPVVTTTDVMEAVERILSASVMSNQPEDARKAIKASAIVMVDAGLMEQQSADQYVASMMSSITTLTPKLDQATAEISDLTEQMVGSYMKVVDANEELESAKAELKVIEDLLEETYTLHQTALYAYARSIAIQRIKRRKFIRRLTAVFHIGKR
jgi:DNA repair exonuclease SbcCD ATPase subunit